MKSSFLFVCLSLVAVVALCDLQDTIRKLSDELVGLQVKKQEDVYMPPFFWIKQKGTFPSYVHVNFAGKPDMNLLRRDLKCFDNNGFTSNFVVLSILEAQRMGTINVDKDVIDMAVEAILEYQDRNQEPGVPIYMFWPQKKMEGGLYGAWATNLAETVKDTESFEHFIKIMLKDVLHAEHLWDEISVIVEIFGDMVASFAIPPDSDDSGCNLALGASLLQSASLFPEAWESWKTKNTNYSALYEAIVNFSYNPFLSEDDDIYGQRLIDPRTYYWIHPFLTKKKQEGSLENFGGIISTWIMSLPQNRKRFPVEGMPMNSNNVDLAVVTNFLYGTFSHLAHAVEGSSSPKWLSQDVINVIRTSSELLTWSFDTGIIEQRPELVLLYYPSVYDFLFFVGRLTQLLDQHSESFTDPSIRSLALELVPKLRKSATDLALKLALHSQDGAYTYWQDFLGLADKDWKENPHPSPDDRLFSTGLCVNALSDVWADKKGTGFRPDTPANVLEALQKSTLFLEKFIFTNDYEEMNAFFSGSDKCSSSSSWSFPLNVCEYLNGTKAPVEIEAITPALIVSVKGYIDETQYTKWCSETWFGNTVPTKFSGFNEGWFPFWSSPSMTYAISMLGLSKYVSRSPSLI